MGGSGMVEVGRDAGATRAASLRLAVPERAAMERDRRRAARSSCLAGTSSCSCLIQASRPKTGVGGSSGAARALCVLARWLRAGGKAGRGAAGFEICLYCCVSLFLPGRSVSSDGDVALITDCVSCSKGFLFQTPRL